MEETRGFLGGQVDGPSRVPLINTIDDVVEALEVAWVGEERRNKVDLVVPGELIDELRLPAIDGGIGAKSAGVSCEGRGKDVAIVPQLVGVIGVASDIITEGTGMLRRGAWHHAVIPIELATITQSEWKRWKAEIYNSRHIERNEELEAGARILGGLVRIIDLGGFPAVGSNVEGEGIDAMVVGKLDIVHPSFVGVGVGVAHNMVGSHNLVAAIPLGNWRNEIAERSKMEGSSEQEQLRNHALTWRPRNGGSLDEESHCDSENELDGGNHCVGVLEKDEESGGTVVFEKDSDALHAKERTRYCNLCRNTISTQGGED